MAHTIRAAAASRVLPLLPPSLRAAALAAGPFAAGELDDPDRLVDLESTLRLTRAAAELAADDSLGLHAGEQWELGALGVLSYAVLNAPTVGTGLRNLDRYGRLHLQGGRVWVETSGELASLCYRLDVPDLELARQHCEGAAVVGLRIVRQLAGEPLRPRRVAFGHRRPADTSEHARIFGCELEFARPGANAVLEFDAAALAREVSSADRRLFPLIERHLDALVADRAPDVWLEQVRSALAESLCDGNPTIREIARTLGTSVRTLQRRLEQRGAVFKDLVSETRLELAQRYLAGDTSLTEIAFLLGYSVLSAFDRAFRRWTGETPRAARRRLRPAERPG